MVLEESLIILHGYQKNVKKLITKFILEKTNYKERNIFVPYVVPIKETN